MRRTSLTRPIISAAAVVAWSLAACGGSTGDASADDTVEGSVSSTESGGGGAVPTSTAHLSRAGLLPVALEAAPVEIAAGSTALAQPDEPVSLAVLVAEGVTATLDLPAGAVAAPVQVSLRPVSISGFAGVVLEPEGLFLQAPAVLRIDGVDADVYQRTGWTDDGVERFAPTWRSSEQGVSIVRLRPLLVAHPLTPSGEVVGTSTTFAPAFTTVSGAAPEPPVGDRPSIDWTADVVPLLGDASSVASDAADIAAWEMERAAEDGDAPDQAQAEAVAGAGAARGRVLVQRCADREAPRRTAEELTDLIDGNAVRITDAREVAGCLVLAWRVSEVVQGHLEVNGESIEIDEVQVASTTAIIDGGSSESTASIFGRSSGQGQMMSVGFSLLGKGMGEYAGLETPDVTSQLCAPAPDQESGSLSLRTDPLPDGQVRLTITVTPGMLDVGCGPDFPVPPIGWDLVSALRGEEPGTPMVMTLPVAPQISRNVGFIEQAGQTTVTTQSDGLVRVSFGQLALSVGFSVALSFAPAA